MTSSIIWPKFDLKLTSIWRDIDVISTSFRRHQWCYRWRHLDIKTLMSFWWWNLWSILTSVFTSNVNEKNWRHVNSFTRIWPNIDVWRMTIIDVYLMSIYVKLMWNRCEIDVYLMTNWCLFDVKLMSIWCQIDVYLMSIWCRFDVNLTLGDIMLSVAL